MAYRDPERARIANAEAQRRWRARQAQEKFKTEEQKKSPKSSSLKKSNQENAQAVGDWIAKKVDIGRNLIETSLSALDLLKNGKTSMVGARDAAQLLKMGIDLVNANLDQLRPVEKESKGDDVQFMLDPVFADLMEQALIRKAELIAKGKSVTD